MSILSTESNILEDMIDPALGKPPFPHEHVEIAVRVGETYCEADLNVYDIVEDDTVIIRLFFDEDAWGQWPERSVAIIGETYGNTQVVPVKDGVVVIPRQFMTPGDIRLQALLHKATEEGQDRPIAYDEPYDEESNPDGFRRIDLTEDPITIYSLYGSPERVDISVVDGKVRSNEIVRQVNELRRIRNERARKDAIEEAMAARDAANEAADKATDAADNARTQGEFAKKYGEIASRQGLIAQESAMDASLAADVARAVTNEALRVIDESNNQIQEAMNAEAQRQSEFNAAQSQRQSEFDDAQNDRQDAFQEAQSNMNDMFRLRIQSWQESIEDSSHSAANAVADANAAIADANAAKENADIAIDEANHASSTVSNALDSLSHRVEAGEFNGRPFQIDYVVDKVSNLPKKANTAEMAVIQSSVEQEDNAKLYIWRDLSVETEDVVTTGTAESSVTIIPDIQPDTTYVISWEDVEISSTDGGFFIGGFPPTFDISINTGSGSETITILGPDNVEEMNWQGVSTRPEQKITFTAPSNAISINDIKVCVKKAYSNMTAKFVALAIEEGDHRSAGWNYLTDMSGASGIQGPAGAKGSDGFDGSPGDGYTSAEITISGDLQLVHRTWRRNPVYHIGGGLAGYTYDSTDIPVFLGKVVPQRGTDYWTPDDVADIDAHVTDEVKAAVGKEYEVMDKSEFDSLSEYELGKLYMVRW